MGSDWCATEVPLIGRGDLPGLHDVTNALRRLADGPGGQEVTSARPSQPRWQPSRSNYPESKITRMGVIPGWRGLGT